MIKLGIAFVAFNALDLVMTLLCVGNNQSEFMPAMGFILTQPLHIIILFKVGLSALFAAALILMRLKTVLRIVVYAMVGICAWNTAILFAGGL